MYLKVLGWGGGVVTEQEAETQGDAKGWGQARGLPGPPDGTKINPSVGSGREELIKSVTQV
jgi:hypothetical protein